MYAQHKLNCDIIGLRKVEKILMTMLILVVRPTIDESIETMKKMILESRRITVREVADDV